MDAPTPHVRARSVAISGTATRLGDREWLLADAVRPFAEVWDRLYDSNVLRGTYDPDDVRLAAFELLLSNYALTEDEAVGLILSAGPQSLVPAVEAALFGPPRRALSHSDWVKGSLWSIGLDPEAVPPHAIRDLLDFLVMTGHALSPEKVIASYAVATHRRKRQAVMEATKARQAEARKAEVAEAAPATVQPPPAPGPIRRPANEPGVNTYQPWRGAGRICRE